MTNEKKKVTVRELQTFIEAVEFAADTDNWVPSERQWKRIRDMIDNLADLPMPQASAPRESAPVQYAPPTLSHSVMQPPPPSRMAQGGMPPPPTSVSGQPAPFANPVAPSIPAKTPDIDTSTGGYQSGFA